MSCRLGQTWSRKPSRHPLDVQKLMFSSTSDIQKMPRDWPCAKEACAIQSCLNANNLNQAKCADVVTRFKECCAAVGARGEYSQACGQASMHAIRQADVEVDGEQLGQLGQVKKE